MAIILKTTVASGDKLDVRHFAVHERICSMFRIELEVLCENPSVDFEAIIGQPASFTLDWGLPGPSDGMRAWEGICADVQLVQVETSGASTYRLTIVPKLWLLSQRRNYRIFQQMTEPDMVLQLLSEWDIAPDVRIDGGAYKTRKYRVQYGESDYAFLCRMLEHAGISFYFEQQGDMTKLVLSDAPHNKEQRNPALPFLDNPTTSHVGEYITGVNITRRVRPGRYAVRDHDYRRPPAFRLMGDAQEGPSAVEQKLERYHYVPGGFLFGGDEGESTPVADDRGKTRHQEAMGALMARNRLAAKRAAAKVISFSTKAHDLAPGMVMRMLDHPHAEVADGKKLLLVETVLSGEVNEDWHHTVEAVSAEQAYRPPLVTPKPAVNGVESATVVGPPGEEIHTDEFGRVRVHFHWDRESSMNQDSSCWIHVSQSWAGSGYGWVTLPRIGQEVLVDFLGGDPDRPIIVGRVFTNIQKVPYKLPDNKTKSGWKSSSSPGGGGYNEFSMEDKAGSELINIQAQKDLNKLVKHDETGSILNNRTHSVGVDAALSVGNNRTHSVGVTESITVGVNQSTTVGVNQSFSVGADQSTSVGANQANTIMANQTTGVHGSMSTEVGGDQSLAVDGNQSTEIGVDQTLAVGANQTIDVGADQSETIGGAQTLTVEADQTILVNAGNQTITVAGGARQLDVSSTITTTAGAAISTTSSGASITLDAATDIIETAGVSLSATAPSISISGDDVVISGAASIRIVGGDVTVEGGNVVVNGSLVDVDAASNVEVNGALVKLNC